MTRLPQSPDHAQCNDAEEEGRRFGDLLRTATNNGSDERVDIQPVDFSVVVYVADLTKLLFDQRQVLLSILVRQVRLAI